MESHTTRRGDATQHQIAQLPWSRKRRASSQQCNVTRGRQGSPARSCSECCTCCACCTHEKRMMPENRTAKHSATTQTQSGHPPCPAMLILEARIAARAGTRKSQSAGPAAMWRLQHHDGWCAKRRGQPTAHGCQVGIASGWLVCVKGRSISQHCAALEQLQQHQATHTQHGQAAVHALQRLCEHTLRH